MGIFLDFRGHYLVFASTNELYQSKPAYRPRGSFTAGRHSPMPVMAFDTARHGHHPVVVAL
jgi:hypothetical protein